MQLGIRLGSKFEPRALTIARIICGVLISTVWLAYSAFQLKKALDPPIGLEYETVPTEMYVPSIIVANEAGQFDNMELLVGGLYPDEPLTLKPIGTVEKIYNYLNSTFTAFVVTPREAH
ncbi:hypothetical protein K7432_015790 [Basidiobolus ranarum]|uniref:MacB-like periplasmic core domain-containing protein n=1 Tax=Basidiobolus ranarum TaxID=34480 RepID=A0ABR2WFM3_9FUNG